MLWIPGALAETTQDVIDAAQNVAETVAPDAVNLNIGIGESFMYAIVGFIIVFIVLTLIIGAIIVTSKLVSSASKKPAEEKKAAPAPAAAPAPVAPKAAPGSCGDIKLYNVSDKEAAMIMAIVADEMKTPLNELRFISIKQIG